MSARRSLAFVVSASALTALTALAGCSSSEADTDAMPVVDEGVLVGIVSERDLLFAERLGSTRSGLLTVSDLMARDPFILQVDSSLSDAVRTMIRDKFGSAVVLDRGNVVGVFTTIDALRALLDRLGAEDV